MTVWYKACPEVTGINPQVMVIWPAKLNYELDLAETKLSLSADGVLHVSTPPIRGDDPSVPSEVGEYMAQTSFWTLDSEQAIVMREMQKATPLARHLTAYFLRNDVGLSDALQGRTRNLSARHCRCAGRAWSRGSRSTFPTVDVKIPPRPELTLCEGSVALANGLAFARRQEDGTVIGIYPKKRRRENSHSAHSVKHSRTRGYDRRPNPSSHSTEIRPWKLSMCVADLSGTS